MKGDVGEYRLKTSRLKAEGTTVCEMLGILEEEKKLWLKH